MFKSRSKAAFIALVTLITLGVVALWAVPAHAQATYETSGAPISVTFDAAGETETHSINAGSGSNRVLLVFVSWRVSSNDLTGATYNGVGMTSAGTTVTNGALGARLFTLASPASGANNLAVTMSAGGGSSIAQISWEVVNTADTGGTPVDGYNSGNGSGSAANIVSSVTISSGANDRVVVFHAAYNESETLSATPTNYTERQDATASNGMNVEHGDAAGAASVATSATWSNGTTSTNWAALGINVNAAAGAATACKRALLGVGCDEP